MRPDIDSFFDELEKIAEDRGEAPDFKEFLRYYAAEPMVRVGVPVALGTGLGYFGAGALHQGLQRIPAVSRGFGSMTPDQKRKLVQVLAAAGAAGGTLGGAALGYHRMRVMDDLHRERMGAREEEE